MHEPRGHHEMYGVVPVKQDDENVDAAVVFIQTEGYSPMCGHASISFGRY